MDLIKINFLEEEVAVITSLVATTPLSFNLDKIINRGLTMEEWNHLRKLLEVETVSIQDKQGNTIPASPLSILKKIDLVNKQR